MDRLQAMQLFTRIVELGSFSRAAEQLSLPRASATQIIKHLEAHLGVRLLQRTTRHVSPTLDGTAYYQRCLAILADIDETGRPSRRPRHPRGEPGRAGLARPHDDPARRVATLSQHPRHRHRRPHRPGARGVDCVLRRAAARLLARRQTAATPSRSPARAGLVQQRRSGHARPSGGTPRGRHVSASFGRSRRSGSSSAGGKPTASSRLAVNGDAYLAASGRLGIVQVPRYRVGQQIADGALVELLPDKPPPDLPLSVLYPHHRHLSPRVRVFVDWLAELLGPLR